MGSPAILLGRNNFLQVIIAIILGILFGVLFPGFSAYLKIGAEGYIQLIKMIINPLIFISIVLGICGHTQTKIARLAVKTIVYFEVLSALAIILAFVVMIALNPGANINPSSMLLESEEFSFAKDNEHATFQSFFLNSIPNNFFGVLAGNNLIAVLVLAVIFAIAIRRVKSNREKVIHFFEILSQIFFQVITLITKLAPIATFFAFAASVGTMGLKSIQILFYFVLIVTLCCLLFLTILYIIGKFYKFSLIQLLSHIKEELSIVFGTSSSEAVFPQMIKKLETFGCSKNIVSFVLPAGYSFNLDGTAIYVATACIFIQQMFHITFSFQDYFTLFLIIMVVSKGAAGVTGAGFVTLSAVLVALPHHLLPLQGLGILIGVDRIISMLRSITNLIGTATTTVIIAKSEGEFKGNKT